MATAERILVVEDEPAIADSLVYALASEGFQVEAVATLGAARAALVRAPARLVVLDVGLPDGSGFDFCRELRRTSAVPVLFLTARGGEIDRVVGLELGADDYVVKPFSVGELLARVTAVLRRSPERASGAADLALPAGTADFARREVRYADGGRAELSQREAELLAYLARNPGRAISRAEILTRVWRLDPQGLSTRAIDMQVARLREKLRDDPAEPHVLLTVRGTGYMLAQQPAAP